MPRPTNRSKKKRVIPPSVPDNALEADETPDGPKSRLPPELWRNIVEEIALSIPDAKARKHALYDLLFTFRDLYPEARRLLYRDITFVHGTPVACQLSDALHAGAAKYVRSMRVEKLIGETERRGRSAKPHFFSLPLESMRGLRSLDLLGSWIKNQSQFAELLRCSIPPDSLVRFHARLVMNDKVLPFFQHQKNIQFLSISRFDNEPTPSLRSRQLLPSLKRFKLHDLLLCDSPSAHNFREFVEDRPITAFHIGNYFQFSEYWSMFAPRLQSLDISSFPVGAAKLEELLEVIVTTAVNLRLFACSQTVYSLAAVNEAAVEPAVFRILRKLHNLEAYAVSSLSYWIRDLDSMIIPEIVGTPTKLKSILVTQRTVTGISNLWGLEPGHELQYTLEGGWTISRRDDVRSEDWFESWLRKLDLVCD
ncbi:hypothetical protein SISNIDRAFT_487654 [Sistotremastrum niveocremeum HHB9708]|uniref:F-box domain-containing protein n=1 Tax=Sistotremastrum niveocremeum HHB9708 TaxID=1314777 RepID=A0A164SCA0_9AGAM|nr:hypothetical protein SISNIDRAFT_487654 [Sistotremastrum niveocremeum HHB9708]